MDRPEEAIADFEQALSLRPDYHPAYLPLGAAYLVTGRFADAAGYFRRARENTPITARDGSTVLLESLAWKRAGDEARGRRVIRDNYTEFDRQSIFWQMARYYELTEHDIIFTVLTDSMELYASRLRELAAERGAYSRDDALRDYEAVMGITTDSMLELRYPDRKRIHNLKYYTWIEQQGRELDELNRQWYDFANYWDRTGLADRIDEKITAFNALAGYTP
jgi:tetratricopeptide (TPR) repeat protein